jgi:hypothetical protein
VEYLLAFQKAVVLGSSSAAVSVCHPWLTAMGTPSLSCCRRRGSGDRDRGFVKGPVRFRAWRGLLCKEDAEGIISNASGGAGLLPYAHTQRAPYSQANAPWGSIAS